MDVTQTPPPTLYHRAVGWHAPALRRAGNVGIVGVVAGGLAAVWTPWQLALVVGWIAAATTFLAVVWPVLLRARDEHMEELVVRRDSTRPLTSSLLTGASLASLLGVGFALDLAGREEGATRAWLIALAVVTVVSSWLVINTVYALRYASIHYRQADRGFGFTSLDQHRDRPDFRDFAYVAFTIGMTYQVSDTTTCDPGTRRVVLGHAVISYVFGVVIVAGVINLISGLLR